MRVYCFKLLSLRAICFIGTDQGHILQRSEWRTRWVPWRGGVHRSKELKQVYILSETEFLKGVCLFLSARVCPELCGLVLISNWIWSRLGDTPIIGRSAPERGRPRPRGWVPKLNKKVKANCIVTGISLCFETVAAM